MVICLTVKNKKLFSIPCVCMWVCVCMNTYIYIYTYINSASCYMKVTNLCVDSCLITGLLFHQTRHQNFSCSSPRSTSREKFFLAMFIMSLIVNIFSKDVPYNWYSEHRYTFCPCMRHCYLLFKFHITARTLTHAHSQNHDVHLLRIFLTK